MSKILLLSFLFLSVNYSGAQTADQILAKSVSYHDPSDQWPKLKTDFYFTEKRPSGEDRFTIIHLDNNLSYMKINRNEVELYEIKEESCRVLKGEKNEERGLLLRNYYLYLWGLPMKLYDENTPINESVKMEKVGEANCFVLSVNYEKDTWYFYIDEFDGRLVQYKFYQDEAETKGELITLEDEIEVNRIKIPQKRSWYTLPDMEYLGTDILTKTK